MFAVGLLAYATLAWLPGVEFPREAPPPEKALPAWQRLLKGQDEVRAREMEARVENLAKAGKFAEALGAAEALAALRRQVQGADH